MRAVFAGTVALAFASGVRDERSANQNAFEQSAPLSFGPPPIALAATNGPHGPLYYDIPRDGIAVLLPGEAALHFFIDGEPPAPNCNASLPAEYGNHTTALVNATCPDWSGAADLPEATYRVHHFSQDPNRTYLDRPNTPDGAPPCKDIYPLNPSGEDAFPFNGTELVQPKLLHEFQSSDKCRASSPPAYETPSCSADPLKWVWIAIGAVGAGAGIIGCLSRHPESHTVQPVQDEVEMADPAQEV
ncbi:hypothetical protein GHT07_20550 [Caenimonas koreensis DSM 17982]|uniref:Uncharacterized protein n=1 Tax=Caenimonas koreensis DSM 17982 TaxID=1121255 RepID=A0A844B4E3_9BURK|nr:hypothetical protein [Caenimonas koreensis]MRD49668.1 hypothetical protein [Caenimonas koreensis DSM 17982]